MTSFNFIVRPKRQRDGAQRGPGRREDIVRDERGVAALEFGILLPFMVVLLAGIADMGRSLWQHHTLTKGVRDAARYLSRVADPSDGTAISNATNLALKGSFDGSQPYLFSHWSTSAVLTVSTQGYDNSGNTFRGNATIYRPEVKVVVTPPDAEFPLLSLFGVDAITYSARVQVRHIGE